MDNGDTENDADEVYAQILGEVGMGMNNEIAAGSGNIAQPAAIGQPAPAMVGADDDM